ncbi:MAG: sulfatase-like hydrolase/transferase [Candidatus Solibacter usitatus]|nr:sulfatase-like hydrolase/transferase [Candidatus Solibacter usitatus]
MSQQLTRRAILQASAIPAALAQRGSSKPNILFISSDQHSGPVTGANGHPVVKTPNLDKLAARGVNFRNSYCGSPVCVPGRAAMMTGMFASDVASYCNSTPFDGRVPTWGNRLRDAGYACWATGKMDLWKGKDFGFREDGTSHGHSQGPDITSLFRMPMAWRSSERKNADGSYHDRPSPDQPKAEKAIRFLRDESRKGQPWCAYVGFTKPHPKFDAALKYKEMYPAARMPTPVIPEGYLEERHAAFQLMANFKNLQVPVPKDRVQRARSAYYGLITELDELIGTVIAELERTGQLENTVIVYTSDHGEMLGEHGLWLKNVLLEGAARVPFVIAGPGIPKGKTIDSPVMHADMVATMLELAGARRTAELRGHSLLPMMNGRGGDHPGFVYAESHSEGNATGSFLIRKGDWKYIYFAGDEPLLFHLKDDPGELHNLARDKRHAAVLKELDGHLRSLVDPDKVTVAAFKKQDEVLRGIIKENSKQEFIDDMKGRLGSLQARMLANKYYET